MENMKMTSTERVMTTLGRKEPDRVPLALTVTMHGAKEVGLSLSEYFDKPENVVEGQLRMREKYFNDILMSFFYGAIDYEAFGGEVAFFDDGPPNSMDPIIKKHEQILHLEPPRIEESPCLMKILRATEMLKERAGNDAPVVGVVISPFSLPIMQMGYDKYLDLIFDRFDLFERLMAVNSVFCIDWANAQYKAGASIIVYFDPVSSTTNTTRDLYLKTGFKVASDVISRLDGPTATHMASGRCIPIIDDIAQTGTAGIGVSALEDLGEIKEICRGRINILGNLNGIEMCRWTAVDAEKAVKDALAKAGKGGGYLLSDNHGEIPFQVSDKTLHAISEAVRKWGNYPLDWVEEYEV